MIKRTLTLTLFTLLLLVACGQADPEPTPTPDPPTATPEPVEPTADPAEAADVDPAERPKFTPGSFYGSTITIAGEPRLFQMRVPDNWVEGNTYPLIFNMHPFGVDAPRIELISNMGDRAGAAGFIVVNPQGAGNTPQWNIDPIEDNPDIALILALIEEMDEELGVDRDRIFMAGFSNGGGMVHRAACELSDVLAGVAPLGGVYTFIEDCSPTRPVPILAFHGDEDDSINYDGDAARGLPPVVDWAANWASLNGCGDGTESAEIANATTETAWDCPENASVRLITLNGWGHLWPNAETLPPGPNDPDADATNMMIEFFQSIGN